MLRAYVKPMKRRTFLSGLAAITSGPALPGGLLGRAASGAALPFADPELYRRAVAWVGLWDQNAPWMLKYRFKLDEDAAQGLFGELVRTQVVAAPDAQGMARVLASTYKNPFHAAKLKTVLARSEMAAAGTALERSSRAGGHKAGTKDTPETTREKSGGNRLSTNSFSPRAAVPADLVALNKMRETQLTEDALETILVTGPVGEPFAYVTRHGSAISALFVVGQERRKGHGSRLLKAAQAQALLQSETVLSCAVETHAALSCFRKYGFHQIQGPPSPEGIGSIYLIKALD